ncbi:MAG: protein kinase [Pirellulales bacterium]
MALRCPYCQHSLAFKDAKPGRYGPKCPKCAKKFVLVVPAEKGAEPVASPLPGETPDAAPASGKTAGTVADRPAAQPTNRATVASTKAPSNPPAITPAPTSPDATGAWSNSPPADPNATGAFTPTTAATAAQPAAPDPNSTGAWATQAAGVDQTMAHQPGQATVEVRSGNKTDAARAHGATVAGEASALPADVPAQLGGYKIVKELGRGGMGSVYLAKQLSLDRNVALKVMQPQWSRDPAFVARFTREAYAAAQLVHHNVVQIYDIGAERDTNYFSMEFVEGQSISDLVKREGKLDPEVAVGYILQAARGLKFAHDQGMIHRDIKPDNLMLNKLGIVKVADLGLVKTPTAKDAAGQPLDEAARSKLLSQIGSDMTVANVAMGTPAYMSPEQGTDAAHVDQRADIYSLGCTLYVMVTGRPPYEGRTALEVMTKHKTEPMVRPELLVKRLPKELGDIIMQMTSKQLDSRYASLDEVILALEGFLGVQNAGPFTPKEEHVQVLEESVKAFNASPAARLKPKLVAAFLGLCVLLFLILAAFKLSLAIGVIGLVGMTAATYFLASGVKERTFLFGKVRELVLGSSWSDWATWIVAGLLFLTALYVLNWLTIWVAFGIAAVGLGSAFYFMFDRQIQVQRAEPVERTEQLLKSLRVKGLDELALRQFVCKYSGDRWEEFFEALFGYEAKLSAREWSRGERGKAREKFRAWRDPLITWIDGKQRARREAKETKHLRKVEEQGLKSQGMTIAEARQRAERTAEALVGQAAQIRETVVATIPGKAVDPQQKRAAIRAMLEAAHDTELAPKKSPLAALMLPLSVAFGARTRFLLGGLLLAGCLLWVRQNGHVFNAEQLQSIAAEAKQSTESAIAADDAAIAAEQVKERVAAMSNQPTRPLALPLFGGLFNSFNAGLAGLCLICSAIFPGLRIALFAFPAAALALVGHAWFGIPEYTLLYTDLPSAGIGCGIMLAGLFLGRSRA